MFRKNGFDALKVEKCATSVPRYRGKKQTNFQTISADGIGCI